MEKSNVKDYEDTCDAVSEYEFPEDSDWEFPRELLELKDVLGDWIGLVYYPIFAFAEERNVPSLGNL